MKAIAFVRIAELAGGSNETLVTDTRNRASAQVVRMLEGCQQRGVTTAEPL
jgi:hypothetical protein